MTTSTLGGMLKDYRIKKRLSQLDVSIRIGWNDTTRLSKIEQGRVGTPTRDTVDKIINVLNLSDQEKGEFLYAGGYLPTDKEIDFVVNQFRQKIMDWKYPAYLMDFSWRMFAMNKPTIEVFDFPSDLLSSVQKLKPNLLSNIEKNWNGIKVYKGDDKNSLRPLNETIIAQFKAEHLGRENERWYKDIINQFVQNEEFRKLWITIEASDYHKKLYEYEYKEVVYPNQKKLCFHVFDSKLVFDRRFTLVLYLQAA